MTPKSVLTFMHRALDVCCLGFIIALVALALASSGRVPSLIDAVQGLVLAGVLYAVASATLRRLRNEAVRVALLVPVALAVLSHLFQAIAGFQHILIDRWLDPIVISWDHALFGIEASVAMQSITFPLLTEWMMCAYVLYVPLLAIVPLLCLRGSGPAGALEYLLTLALTNVVCYSGFVLFPVAGPMIYQPEAYAVPLAGGLFTWCGEWIRSTMHYPGGCLPSPHCAATTVMLAMLYRHNRRWFWIPLPLLVSVYAATVYGRYHYSWDSVAGLLVALGVISCVPLFVRAVARLAERWAAIAPRRTAPDALPG